MEIKYWVFALLWLAACRRGESFAHARVTDITNSNKERWFVFVTQSTNEVGWFVCRRVLDFIKTIEMGSFECKRFGDYADTPSAEDYFVFVTHFTNISEDDWFLRIRLSDYKNTHDENWFRCQRLDDFTQITALDYVVFIRHGANTNEKEWFVCKRFRFHDCTGEYCWSIRAVEEQVGGV